MNDGHSGCEYTAEELMQLTSSSSWDVRKKARRPKHITLGVLVVFTFGYLLFLVWLISTTEACAHLVDNGQMNWITWIASFPRDFLSCRTVNELGDALAGAFAPLAFIWLAGAVFIQSQELSETRDVMEQQLKVMGAQVDETEASKLLLKAQTALLELQHQYQLADDEFEKLLLAVRRKMQDESFLWMQFDLRLQNFDERIASVGSDDEFFQSIKDWLESVPDDYLGSGDDFVRVNMDHDVWSEVLKLLTDMLAIFDKCSPAHRRLFDVYHIKTIEDYVRWLMLKYTTSYKTMNSSE